MLILIHLSLDIKYIFKKFQLYFNLYIFNIDKNKNGIKIKRF